MSINLESFLERNRIDADTWQASEMTADALDLIYKDYLNFRNELTDCAEIYAKKLQRIEKVHSVRWRVKDPEHVLEKIVRKRAERNEKYLHIDQDNYYETITDLVGVRAIHLFKEDFSIIDQEVRREWELTTKEKPTFYLREGDPKENIDTDSFDIKHHPAGYRSVHYIATSQPAKRTIHLELQVRTLFEEGWSEIDHTIRYPNFSDNQLTNYFLTIFNRLAGNADEMGSFVKNLASALAKSEESIRSAIIERDKALEDMERTVTELGQLRIKSEGSEELIEKLKNDISKLKIDKPSSEESQKYHNAGAALRGIEDFDFKAFSSMLESAGITKNTHRNINTNAQIKALTEILRLPRS